MVFSLLFRSSDSIMVLVSITHQTLEGPWGHLLNFLHIQKFLHYDKSSVLFLYQKVTKVLKVEKQKDFNWMLLRASSIYWEISVPLFTLSFSSSAIALMVLLWCELNNFRSHQSSTIEAVAEELKLNVNKDTEISLISMKQILQVFSRNKFVQVPNHSPLF